MNDTPPLGQRFSHVYLKRGQPMSDSARMRKRLAILFSKLPASISDGMGFFLEGELGVSLPKNDFGYKYGQFFDTSELSDLLDSITLIYSKIPSDRRNLDVTWLSEIRRIFQEENISYTIDGNGGVRLAVDTEYEHNRTSTIIGLGSSRYNGVLTEYEKAYAELDKVPPDGKNAIRSAFEAMEILFKLLFENKPRQLNGDGIQKHLVPLIENKFSADKTALESAQNLLECFKFWAKMCHPYRHGQGKEEPVQPHLSLAVLTVSTAASYLRWLAEFDTELQKKP